MMEIGGVRGCVMEYVVVVVVWGCVVVEVYAVVVVDLRNMTRYGVVV